MTVSPENEKAVENILSGIPFAKVGSVTGDSQLNVKSAKYKDASFALRLNDMLVKYKSTLDMI